MINKAGKKKNTILVINKLDLDKYIDAEEHDMAISEYMVHGFENII
jgi:Ni2+-binding GTPase involved in maturation of urease and hydrogenase